METEEEIRRLSYFFPREQMKVLLPLWYEGVVYQLTTMPPEIMTNKWIYDSFPELRPAMLKSLAKQRVTAIHALSPEVRKITPSIIYNASNIMNYVYFKILEDHLHFDYVSPYHKTAFIYEGSSLAKLTERLHENSHEGDRTIIDLWSVHLNLVNWYEWRSFDVA
ncbi:MAG: hypothetical protein N2317_05870 [Syntrophales bacterium]|nr:hypothetical protein [Syntrophales bacterium]